MPDDAGPEEQGSLRRDLGRVLGVAIVAVVVVLGIVIATNPVSRDIRTPVTIAVLILGTAWVLWQITRQPRPS